MRQYRDLDALMRYFLRGLAWATMALMPARIAAQGTPPLAAQNPSPMVENTRPHERLVQRELAGISRTFVGPAEKPVELFIPQKTHSSTSVDLVLHFHGASWIPNQAVSALSANGTPTIAATVNVGTGSGAYDRAFADPAVYDALLAAVMRELSTATGQPTRINHVTLVGFSAGHGAVRAILRNPTHFASVAAVVLIDGMHTSYIPEGTALANGGSIDTTNLVAFANFARAAMRGEKRFLVTHSEIFPGTYASTTETADWLLTALNLRRTPTLATGPRGTQQLSGMRSGNFELLGYAGNSAPDHIDQFHSMPELLARLGAAPNPALVGSWTLVSRLDSGTTGTTGTLPADGALGADPISFLTYDTFGNVSAQLMARRRTADTPKPVVATQSDPNNSAPSGGYDAYFGHYTVDVAAGTVTHELLGALAPADAGRKLTRHFALDGDVLRLWFETTRADGTPVRRTLTWNRVR
ncbi:MAG: lipocalin-like domain-containing protein [Gemmatimonadetes bacterium]|nr:lipocalin-like domain-containing protein [Gemmatimonadota bacterium]